MTSVVAGATAGFEFDFTESVDTDSVTMTVRNSLGSSVYTVADPSVIGGGLYGFTWLTTTSTADGMYTATATAAIDGEPVSSTLTMWVSSGRVYVDLDEMKRKLFPGVTDTDEDLALIDTACAVAEKVESECGGRQFQPDDSPTSRIYPQSSLFLDNQLGVWVLQTDDLATTSGMTVEYGDPITGSWATDDGPFVGRPFNSTSASRPFTSIAARDFDANQNQAIRVTGLFGWPVTPRRIVKACELQISRIHSRRGSPEGIAGNAEWGVVRVPRLDPDVVEMLRGMGRRGRGLI